MTPANYLRIQNTYFGYIGDEQERCTRQEFELDLTLYTDIYTGTRTDRLEDTIDWYVVDAVVQDILKHNSCLLLGTLALEVRTRLCKRFPRIISLEICLTKLNILGNAQGRGTVGLANYPNPHHVPRP